MQRQRYISASTLVVLTLCGLAACTVPKRGPQTAAPRDVLANVRDHTGSPVAKDALRGHWSVLWFYPKAQTSG